MKVTGKSEEELKSEMMNEMKEIEEEIKAMKELLKAGKG
jgi:hypothetical protein